MTLSPSSVSRLAPGFFAASCDSVTRSSTCNCPATLLSIASNSTLLPAPAHHAAHHRLLRHSRAAPGSVNAETAAPPEPG